jgi:hypothetical protein
VPTYRVRFYKKLLSSDGHGFKCLQRTIDVDAAPSPEDAIRSAWLDYDRATNGGARRYADVAEAEIVPPAQP